MPHSAIVDDLAPTGALRASINLGNPVLAQGTADAPRGITVELAGAIAARLGVGVSLTCFDAARRSFEAVASGSVDVGFLAVEPARAAEVAFTAPYVVIDGAFVVPDRSPIRTVAEVDQPGVRIGVNRGSAYDLYLTRTLSAAELVRGDDGLGLFLAERLEVGAGIRQPVAEFADQHPGHRVVAQPFTQIQQAVALPRTKRPESVVFVHDLVEELKASGFVAQALGRSGRTDAEVAPPAPRR